MSGCWAPVPCKGVDRDMPERGHSGLTLPGAGGWGCPLAGRYKVLEAELDEGGCPPHALCYLPAQSQRLSGRFNQQKPVWDPQGRGHRAAGTERSLGRGAGDGTESCPPVRAPPALPSDPPLLPAAPLSPPCPVPTAPPPSPCPSPPCDLGAGARPGPGNQHQ